MHERDHLSPNILPNLKIFRNPNESTDFDFEIHDGRKITHLFMPRVYDSFAKLAEVAPHLKVLDFSGFGDEECLEALTMFVELLPNLECLSSLKYYPGEVNHRPCKV
jgi:hypothetical protein